MRCVPTRPFVDAPQITNVRVSSQKSRDRSPSARASMAMRAGFAVAAIGAAPAVPPYAVMPRSAGRSRRRANTIGIMSAAAEATMRIPNRQPSRSMTDASSGRKMSCPVAVLAVRMPSASPRRATNQRLTIVAPSTSAAMPLPEPTTPQRSTSCPGCLTSVASDTLAVRSVSAMIVVRLTPRRCMRAPANG